MALIRHPIKTKKPTLNVHRVTSEKALERLVGKLVASQRGDALYERTEDFAGSKTHFLIYVPKAESSEIEVDSGEYVTIRGVCVDIDNSRGGSESRPYSENGQFHEQLIYKLLAKKLKGAGVKI